MRSPFTALYIHLIWATWDRLPLIKPGFEDRLAAAMAAKCRELGVNLIAVGMVCDHTHLLVRIPPTLSISTLAKEIKGSTSHLVNHVFAPEGAFKWQGGYTAYSMSKSEVPSVTAYIEAQKRHHGNDDLRGDWEATDVSS